VEQTHSDLSAGSTPIDRPVSLYSLIIHSHLSLPDTPHRLLLLLLICGFILIEGRTVRRPSVPPKAGKTWFGGKVFRLYVFSVLGTCM